MALEWLGAVGNTISSIGGALVQNELGKANEKRQWDEYYSPKAQVRNMAAAGINPAVAFGNQSPVLTSGGQMQMPDVPNLGIGTTALSEIGNYLNAAANAKKAGVDTRSAEEDIKLKQIEQSRNSFENKLRQQFGLKQAAQDLALSEANVRLAQLSGDNAELEKAIKEYTKAKEKALSECAENQRDILSKELANKDTELKLSNRVLQTQGDSNIASANASNAAAVASRAAAKNSEAEAFINEQEGRIRKVLADNETNPQVVRKKLETLFEELKAKKMQSTLDAEKAFEEWRHINYENEYFMDKKYDARVDYFLSWLRKRIGAFPIP